MFLFLAVIGVIASFFLFINGINTGFSDPASITNLVAMIITTILCVKLMKMDYQIKENETEIQKLKKHLNIKHEDPVMNSYLQNIDNEKTDE